MMFFYLKYAICLLYTSWAIRLNVNTTAIDVSALLQIWILFLFALMKKTVRIRNLYCIRKDENREK